MGRYDLHAHIETQTADELATALRAIAHHIEAEHDLTAPGEVVNTLTAGGHTSWSVRVVHDRAEVNA